MARPCYRRGDLWIRPHINWRYSPNVSDRLLPRCKFPLECAPNKPEINKVPTDSSGCPRLRCFRPKRYISDYHVLLHSLDREARHPEHFCLRRNALADLLHRTYRGADLRKGS